jgi:quercetin dioxygenase-like cupin family protein
LLIAYCLLLFAFCFSFPHHKTIAMKPLPVIASFFLGSCLTLALVSFTGNPWNTEGYIVEHEQDIAREEPGPHKGGGNTTAYPFFAKADDLPLVFRKRTLRPGSSIGYHLQEKDEIYYIIQGKGEMTMNGKTFSVKAGDAILTRPGNSHGLQPTGKDSLTLLINYNK